MTQETEKIEKGEKRRNKGWDNLIPIKPGEVRNPNGRKKLTEEQKEIKKAAKELIEDYKRTLVEALPKISPALIKKAQSGNILAIKEINDRVMGKAKETIEAKIGVLNINQLLDDIEQGKFPEAEG